MPKTSQTIVIEGGGARRLMVRGKKGVKVMDVGGGSFQLTNGCLKWVPDRTPAPLNGPYIGTKKVPRDNARKHPVTGEPQTVYVWVQHPMKNYYENHHAVPPSDVEFYWQRGTVKNGRFYPDKEVTPPDQEPALTTP